MEAADHLPAAAGVTVSGEPALPAAGDALSALFGARSIAVVGASGDPTKLSGLALSNLARCGFDGEVHAVNRRGITIDGIPTFRSILDIDRPVDAGIVMVPAEHAVGAVTELGARGARVAVVAVSGFAELGTPAGRRLQRELLRAGRAAGVRIVGPNCNGVYHTRRPLSLGYNHIHGLRLRPGGVALLSHSGAMAAAAVGLIEPFGAGLSHFVSCGNEADLALIDYAEFLLEDPDAQVFALILDSVEDGPRFRRFARRARDLGKPVLALKLGDSDRGRRATLAHSSRLSGTRAVYESVFAEDGVTLAPTLESLMVAAGLASTGRGTRRAGTIVGSTSGAGCIVMTDALDRVNVPLQPLTAQTAAELAGSAGFAQVLNPFDLGASGSQYRATPMEGPDRNVFEVLLEVYKPTIAALNGCCRGRLRARAGLRRTDRSRPRCDGAARGTAGNGGELRERRPPAAGAEGNRLRHALQRPLPEGG